MPKAGRFRTGVPCWIDLAVPDPQRARRFYGELFGWEFVDTGGGFAVATLRGAAVAMVGPQLLADDPGGGAWRTYLAADDVDLAAARVREAGGRLLGEPFDVPDQGRSASAVDALGVAFGIWQGGANPGAGLVNEPGALTWNDHLSTDPQRAREFYRRVFGHSYRAVPDGPDGYTVIRVGEQPAGGIGSRPAALPGAPAAWLTYFGAAGTEALVERLTELGGEVVAAPRPTPFGTVAVVRDDGGAAFGLIGVAAPASGR